MTAHSTIKTPQQQRQSLEAQCKAARWELLQAFGRLELNLSRFLCAQSVDVPLTFGQKLNSAIPLCPALKALKTLTAQRNLLAHAVIEIVSTEDAPLVVMQVADTASARNALVLDRDGFELWRKETAEALQAALAATT